MMWALRQSRRDIFRDKIYEGSSCKWNDWSFVLSAQITHMSITKKKEVTIKSICIIWMFENMRAIIAVSSVRRDKILNLETLKKLLESRNRSRKKKFENDFLSNANYSHPY